jgi:hypothetical protein
LQSPGGGTAADHVNPGQLLASQTWDLEVFQKYDDSGTIKSKKFQKVMDCRFERKGGGLNKRGIMVEQFSFRGILAEDDSFNASNSGDSDLSTT